MRLYRICPTLYLQNYSGLGASFLDGGRWNSSGTPALYFALSPATALLEIANYLPSPRLVPADYRLGIFQLPENVKKKELSPDKLPANWFEYPYPPSTQRIGDKWLNKCSEAILLVPSTAVPQGLENIAVFNPSHPDSRKIQLIKTISDLYNQRIFS